MCLNPITIHNKGLKYNPGPFNLSVPCGKCAECGDVHQNDYFVRAFSVWRNLPKHWSAFFCDFTFANEYLPHVKFAKTIEYKCDVLACEVLPDSYPSFDHTLMKRFLKSFYQYYIRKTGEKPHYIVTCEYGEKRHRPHYHAALFVPELITFNDFQEVLHKFWHYGFTTSFDFKLMDGKKESRSPENSIRYVCKYVVKGNTWLPEYLTNRKFRDFIPSIDWYNLEPRVFTSNGFGAQFEQSLTRYNYISNSLTLTINGRLQTFTIPYYYKRRYFCSDEIISSVKLKENVNVLRGSFIMNETKTRICKKQRVNWKNDYFRVRYDTFKNQLRKKYFDALTILRGNTPTFKLFLQQNDYDLNELLKPFELLSRDEFVDIYLNVLWSNHPIKEESHAFVSIPLAQVMQMHPSGDSILDCWMYENGLTDFEEVRSDMSWYYNLSYSSQEWFDMFKDSLKNLPSKLNYVTLHHNNIEYAFYRKLNDPGTYCAFGALLNCLDIIKTYQCLDKKARRMVKKEAELNFYKNHLIKKGE